MLAKNHRLSKNSEIKKVLSKGRAFFNPFFTLKYLKTHENQVKFTVVVSTKVSKLAVKRNRIKRLLREKIKTFITTAPSGDYMILCKPEVAKAEEALFIKSFIELYQKFLAYGQNSPQTYRWVPKVAVPGPRKV